MVWCLDTGTTPEQAAQEISVSHTSSDSHQMHQNGVVRQNMSLNLDKTEYRNFRL
jgi:hypothetical protein